MSRTHRTRNDLSKSYFAEAVALHASKSAAATGSANDVQFEDDLGHDLMEDDPTNQGSYILDVRGLQEVTLEAVAGNNGSLTVAVYGRIHEEGNETQLVSSSISANNAVGEILDRKDIEKHAYLRVTQNAPNGDTIELRAFGTPLGSLDVLRAYMDRATDSSKEPPQTRDGTHERASTTGQSTTASWANLVSLERDDNDFYKEVKPYVKETGSSNAIDVRILVATDPTKASSDAPTGSLSDGDGFVLLDEVSDLSAGGDWPDMSGAGYEVDTHLIVVQVQDGSGGSGTADGYLTADRAK